MRKLNKILGLVLVSAVSVGCGDVDEVRTVEQKIRPTESNAQLGISYGAETAKFYDSSGGNFRVWFTESGDHAVSSTDENPADGIPDFVNRVAEVADSVGQFQDEQGWRAVPSDADQTLPNGGDGRFDIYLVNFGGSSDGALVRNSCTAAGCTSHFLMENDFFGYNYPNIEEAIRILVSHEYFHAVQAAYTDELPAWWSEGTATWFQEVYDSDQSDFENKAARYFEDVDRSLNSRSQGPFDGFSYSTSLFPFFLSLQFGNDLILSVFDHIADDETVEGALEMTLQERDSTLAESFGRFAYWNVFTGSRAVDGQGYPQSSQFPEVSMRTLDASRGANWDVEVDPLAASYAILELGGPKSISVESIDGFGQATVYVGTTVEDATILSEESYDFDAEAVFVAVSGGNPDRNTAVRVKVRNVSTAENNQNNATNNGTNGATNGSSNNVDGGADEEGGCATGKPNPSRWLVAVVLLGLCVGRKRGRKTTR